MKGSKIYWKPKYPGSNLQQLIQDDAVLVTINWDVIRQEWYAMQGKKGKPQYVFKGISFSGSSKVKTIVYNIVKGKLK